MSDATTNAAPVGFDAIERVAQQIQSGLFVLLAVLGVVGVIAVVVKQKTARAKDRQYPYARQTSLFTRAERMFFHTLELAVSDRYRVFAMVRVADVLTPERSLARKPWQGAFNRISAKHFDFVLCERSSLTVVAAVELDDKSHRALKRRNRDDFLEGACASARLPLIRQPVQARYDVDSLRECILAAIPNRSAGAPGSDASGDPEIGDLSSIDGPELAPAPEIDDGADIAGIADPIRRG